MQKFCTLHKFIFMQSAWKNTLFLKLLSFYYAFTKKNNYLVFATTLVKGNYNVGAIHRAASLISNNNINFTNKLIIFSRHKIEFTLNTYLFIFIFLKRYIFFMNIFFKWSLKMERNKKIYIELNNKLTSKQILNVLLLCCHKLIATFTYLVATVE